MPDWLATYRADLWAGDLEDLLEVYYFGRFRWREARQEWALGGRPEPSTEIPRLRATDSVNTIPISATAQGPPGPQGPNYVPAVHQARPIKLH